MDSKETLYATSVPIATRAPVQSSIGILADPNVKGLVVRQYTQVTEVAMQQLGIPIEHRNQYMVSALPEGRAVKHTPYDKKGWSPSAEEMRTIEPLLFVQEESGFLMNMMFQILGMSNLRSLKLRFRVRDGGDVYVVDRPFQCGGECCCPLTMNLFRSYKQVENKATGVQSFEPDAEVLIGRIHEDWDNYCTTCFRCCFKCTHNHQIQKPIVDASGQMKFTTEFVVTGNTSCCGPTNNCCGATCCKNDAVFVIFDKNGNEVGHLQKTYGGGDGLGACCRMMYQFDNYVLEFPEGVTSVDDRMLILASVFQLDYHLFEAKGNEGGG